MLNLMNETLLMSTESLWEQLSNWTPFDLVIQLSVSVSVMMLFIAIGADFLLFHNNEQKVAKEKKSIVETGTMTLFLIVFYGVVVSQVGVVHFKRFYSLQYVLEGFGALLILTGCAANIAGRFNLGANWGNQVRIYEGHELVETGLYRFVRHPLYASIILMFFGACLIYHTLAGFLLVVIIFIPFMTYRAKQEEKLLNERFEGYKTYMEKTGRFFPKIMKLK